MTLRQTDRLALTGWRQQIEWYAHRLAVMTPAELAHRGLEQQRRLIARWRWPDFAAWIGDKRRLIAPLPWLVDGVREAGADPALLAEWQAVAAAVRTGRIRLFGRTWPAAATPDWHLDPDSGGRWPDDVYCFDIPYRHAKGLGDVKLV